MWNPSKHYYVLVFLLHLSCVFSSCSLQVRPPTPCVYSSRAVPCYSSTPSATTCDRTSSSSHTRPSSPNRSLRTCSRTTAMRSIRHRSLRETSSCITPRSRPAEKVGRGKFKERQVRGFVITNDAWSFFCLG